MTKPDFKPSQVHLWRAAHLPLIATFGRAELEMAAATMVLALRDAGDEWGPITIRQIGLTLRKHLDDGELRHIKENPFAPIPDHRGLVAKGFAEFDGDPDNNASIRFTEKGIEVLRTTLPTMEKRDGDVP